jgi:hypothetical protein
MYLIYLIFKGPVKVVKFDETSWNQKPWNGLYTRWTACSPKPELLVCGLF